MNFKQIGLIMRLTTVLFIASLMQVSAAGFAQKITLKQRNASLNQVLREIRKQSGFDIYYDSKDISKDQKVNVDFKEATIEQALSSTFKGLDLTYEIEGKTIAVKRKTPSFLDKAKSVILNLVQDLDVRGIIRDEQGNPMPNATIVVKGKSQVYRSNDKGEFNIPNVADDAVLLISYVGYQRLEINVKDVAIPLEIKLLTISTELKEVTINTGYHQISAERFVGAATVIGGDILERHVGRDLLTRLDGSTNGLLFNKSSGAGVMQIQLRGISTLNNTIDLNGISSQNPLIILDDFPFTGDIRNINPNTIESISVLKDAAAVSIWGARAGNGVLVIKSKTHNTKDRVTVSFNSNISTTEKPDVHYFPQMSSNEFIDVEENLFSRGFYDLHIQYPKFFSTSPVVDILAKQRSGNISESEAVSQINALRSQDVRDDASEYIYRHAIRKQNFLNISGGSNSIGYNLSIGADNNLSSIQGPGKDNRYTLNTRLQFTPIRPLEITLGIDYSQEKIEFDGISFPLYPGGKSILPYARLKASDGTHLTVPTTFGSSYLTSLSYDKLLDWQYRPLDERDLANNNEATNLIRINWGTKIRFTSWLTGDLKYLYTRQTSDNRYLRDENTYFTRDLINQFTDPVTFNRNIPYGGILDTKSSELSSHNVRGQLNIHKNWRELHDLSALIAGEMSQSRLSGEYYRLYGYDENVARAVSNIDYSTSLPKFLSGRDRIPNLSGITERNNNLVSILANASYTYDSRYGLYISARRDGSNLFGVNTNNKYKPLWSVGGRWNISNESYYNVKWINNLSIRITYGYAGNINNTISSLATISHSSRPNLFGEPYATLGSAPNPDLRWEEVSTLNTAVDFAIFSGRISGSVEWYQKKSIDVVASFPVDPTLGIANGTLLKNAANLSGRGVDLGIISKNITGRFSWITNANFSYAKTVVDKYFVETKSVPNTPIIREGDVYNGLYAYRWAGLEPLTGDPQGYIGNETSTSYRGIFQDSLENQQYIGSPFPLYYGNLMNTFTYSGFSLSANITFRADYFYQKPTINYYKLFNNWIGHGDFANRWQKPGDELTTNIPSMSYPANADRDKFYENSAVNFEKGDHIRLQDIRLSYRLTNSKTKARPNNSIEFYGYVGNLNIMIWRTSKGNYDPDFPTGSYPPLTTYSLGIKFTL